VVEGVVMVVEDDHEPVSPEPFTGACTLGPLESLG
jgi:hypothetical protein